MNDDEPTTEELKISQLKRELAERESARQAEPAEETEQHDRRADKAAYLREKLTERGDAERRADEADRD